MSHVTPKGQLGIRTYYWHDRLISRPEMKLRKWLHRSPHLYFLRGNAGDLVGPDIIARHYAATPINDNASGRRLLLVGSIAHRIRHGDVLCGIGTKGLPIPSPREARVRILGVRGPITRDAFKAAGHPLDELRMMLDPGLLVRFLYADLQSSVRPHGAIFIPHYRERALYRDPRSLPPGLRLVDIDDTPQELVRQILGAELVFASSLHGIIFAHALSRPVVWVQPQTDEPLLKYEDYFASINVGMPRPIASIQEARHRAAPMSPTQLDYREEDFALPDISFLTQAGVAADLGGAR